MEFIKNNFEIIIIVLSIIMLLILIRVYLYNVYYSKYFTNKKFQVRSTYEINPKDQSKNFVIYVYNKNINDVSINSLGFIYRDQSIDYFKKIKEELIAKDDMKLVIPARDAIKVIVPVDEFELIIYENNRSKKKIGSILCYVTDTLGVQSKYKAKSVQYIVKKDYRQRVKDLKNQVKKAKQEVKIERRNDQRIRREDQSHQRKIKKEVNHIKKEPNRKLLKFMDSIDKLMRKLFKKP